MKSNLFLKINLVLALATLFMACSSDNDNNEPVKKSYSPYITKVFDYSPAVGVFTNVHPTYVEGDTKEVMRLKAEEAIKGTTNNVVTLGGFGGSITFGFDHTITNVAGKKDFRVRGNAFIGSSEPGIIMVAYDKNKNGIPDDEWYEIAGSEHSKASTMKNYTINYYRPTTEAVPQIDDNTPLIINENYIKWTDNKGNEGYKVKNKINKQSYFPQWIDKQTEIISFSGTLLPNNAVNKGTEEAQSWVSNTYAWGYADNAPNNSENSAIDIDWAIDANGNKANLSGIDFVKVYTAVNQQTGWTGEISTEITGAEDLHLIK